MIARITVKGFLLTAVFALSAGVVHADAIDGDWCSAKEAKHLTIAGANIITPSGNQTTGNYSRHSFSYVIPGTDPGAGSTVGMVLLNEQEVRISGISTSEEVWKRCKLVS